MTEQVGWTMDVEAGEPVVAEWRVVDMAELWAGLSVRRPERGPLIIAVDGRSAAGKSTLARALAAMAPGVGVVHTDDLAWYEPLFGWAHLLRDGVLAPTRRGERVSFAPPAWRERGRPGAVEVDAELDCLIVEGVGSAHSSGADLLDAVVWMQCDRHTAERRGIERDLASGENGDREATQAFWDEWSAAERECLAADRPWERASVVVAGTPPHPFPDRRVAIADGPLVMLPQPPRSACGSHGAPGLGRHIG